MTPHVKGQPEEAPTSEKEVRVSFDQMRRAISAAGRESQSQMAKIALPPRAVRRAAFAVDGERHTRKRTKARRLIARTEARRGRGDA